MSAPREPRGPGAGRGASTEDATPRSEPFVRLAKLPPVRAHRDGASASYEERTGALIRRASFLPGLDPPSLQRVWGRLEIGAGSRRRRPVGLVLRWGAAAAVLLVSGAVVGAETGVWTWPRVVVQRLTRPAPDAATVQAGGAVRAARTRKLARVQPSPAASPAQPASPSLPVSPDPPPGPPGADQPAIAAPPLADTRPVPPLPARARVSASRPPFPGPRAADLPPTDTQPPPAAAAPGSALAAESAMLGRALTHLRQRHDAAEALAELDRYGARFPSGVLSAEAERTRVDALLTAGRLDEARGILARLTLGSGRRDLELRVIRAELTAGSRGSCAAALRDYEAALTESRGGTLGARALWGRAACKSRLGDDAGARLDLADYLQRFPAGPHAGLAAARLRSAAGVDTPGAMGARE